VFIATAASLIQDLENQKFRKNLQAEQEDESKVVTPLDYMLSATSDPAVEPTRRGEMAKVAVPYSSEGRRGGAAKKSHRLSRAPSETGFAYTAAKRCMPIR
jgi:hypothetical protein